GCRSAHGRNGRAAAGSAREDEKRGVRAEAFGRDAVVEPHGDRDLGPPAYGRVTCPALACRKLCELRADDLREVVRHDAAAEQAGQAHAGRGVVAEAERALSAVPEIGRAAWRERG